MSDDRREPYFVLNVNDGTDVLHRDPGERCNTQADEMEGRQTVDAKTAEALLAKIRHDAAVTAGDRHTHSED